MASNKQFNRETLFLETIGSPNIDMNQLQRHCSSGIVETCGIRAICWRLLLNCLSTQRSSWPSDLEKQRKDYQQFLDEIIVAPSLNRSAGTCADVSLADHPLNPNPNSEWNTFFKENGVLLQIDKDVRRLCPDISFFQHATQYPCKELVSKGSKVETLRKRVERSVLNSQNFTRKKMGISNLISARKQATQEYETLLEGQEAHWEVVERLLFIYAKLNPGTSYVQGMNEIIGPLYYTFASDPDINWREHAEADTFICFTNLMGEIRDNFIKTLDKSRSGIVASMNRVMCLLRQYDPEVWVRVDELKIKPEYFLFRWITLLLSQEFPLPDVIQIWDVLFSDKNRFNMLIAVCCAMIVLLRDQLLTSDFSCCVKLLQNYPVDRIDINAIIAKAKEILPNLNK